MNQNQWNPNHQYQQQQQYQNNYVNNNHPYNFQQQHQQQPHQHYNPNQTNSYPPYQMNGYNQNMNGYDCGQSAHQHNIQPYNYQQNSRNNFNNNRPNVISHKQQQQQNYNQLPKQSYNKQNIKSNHNQKVSNPSCRCEPCERDFTNETALVAHKKMHVTCEEPNCNFSASNKAVKLHFIQTHAEGKFRIVLQTKADIIKWRDERKKNFPTVSNIDAKRKKQNEYEDAGVRLATNDFHYIGKTGNIKKNNRRNRNGNDKQVTPEVNNNNKSMKVTADVNCGYNKKSSEINKESEQSSLSGLGLLQSYEEDEESDGNQDVRPNSIDTSRTVNHSSKEGGELEVTTTLNETGKEEGELQSEDEEKLDDSTPKNNLSPNPNKKVCQKNNKKRKNNKNGGNVHATKHSLLQMLLAKEIRQERNMILQCIRYIIEENFFENS